MPSTPTRACSITSALLREPRICSKRGRIVSGSSAAIPASLRWNTRTSYPARNSAMAVSRPSMPLAPVISTRSPLRAAKYDSSTGRKDRGAGSVYRAAKGAGVAIKASKIQVSPDLQESTCENTTGEQYQADSLRPLSAILRTKHPQVPLKPTRQGQAYQSSSYGEYRSDAP